MMEEADVRSVSKGQLSSLSYNLSLANINLVSASLIFPT